MANERRRRTERLFLRYPIRVAGFDSGGARFEETSHTIVVNRHGGRVLLRAQLTPGQTVRITHAVTGRDADFRVVGLAGLPGQDGGEWGVECRDEGVNFWGITFPPMDESLGSSSVLLECSKCHDVALTVFSMVEYDLLENSGALPRMCNSCRTETTWGYAMNPTHSVEPAAPLAEAPPSPQASAEPVEVETSTAVAVLPERRRSPRVSLRLPIRLQNEKDLTDLTKSENLSKVGVAFTSDKVFEVGEILQVVCPFNPHGDNIAVSGRVVRREEVTGTGRYIYGIEYQK